MLKLNYGQHTPVRVLYPESVFARLVKNLKTLPAEDRIGLLSDTYATCKAGLLDATFLVQLLAGFKEESNDKVWSELGSVIGGLDKVVCQGLEDATAQAFTNMASTLVAPAFKMVGWDMSPTDDDNRKKLRSTVCSLLSKYCSQDEAIVSEAVKRCKSFVAAPNDSSVLAADIRPAVLELAIQSPNAEAIMGELVTAHEAATDGAVKIHIYAAMGRAPTAALRKRALDFTLSGAVRSQDLMYIPMSMATSSKEGSDTVFSWIQSEYQKIYDFVGSTSMMLFQHFVRISGAGFVTDAKAEEVSAFWKTKDIYKNVEKSLAQTVEGIKSNAKFVDRLKASKAADAATWKAAVDSKL